MARASLTMRLAHSSTRSPRAAALGERAAGARGGPPARNRRDQGRVAPGEGFSRGLDAGCLVELLRKLPRGGGIGRYGCHELIAAPEQGLETAFSMLWRRRRESKGIIRRTKPKQELLIVRCFRDRRACHRFGECIVKFGRAER